MNSPAFDISALRSATAGVALTGFTTPGAGAGIRRVAGPKISKPAYVPQRTSLPKISKKAHA